MVEVRPTQAPGSPETERALLAAILVENAHLASAASVLAAEDFASSKNAKVYRAMIDLAESRRIIDPFTLEVETEIPAVDIAALLDGMPRVQNVDEWARIIKDKSTLRRAAAEARAIQALAESPDASADEVLEQAHARILALSGGDASSREGFQSPELDMQEAAARLTLLREGREGVAVATGIRSLDSVLMGGFMPGDLVLIGARPSVGKTALGLHISDGAAAAGKRVAFFSLEMGRDSLNLRRVCAAASVSLTEGIDRSNEKALYRMTKAFEVLRERPFHISDSFETSPSKMRAKTLRLQQQYGPVGLVVVDYLQLIEGADMGRENRQVTVSAISRALKGMARDLNVPVLALSQLNRGAVDRDRPRLSDLRESGALEQDADVVLLMHRDENNGDEWRGVCEINVAKHRNGPTGTVKVSFQKDTGRFAELAVGEWE